MTKPRRKRTFANESEMMRRLLPTLERFLRSREPASSLSISREVGAGATFADAVALLADGPAPDLSPRPLTGVESAILAQLRRSGPSSLDRLGAECRVPLHFLKSVVLRKLQKLGVLAIDAGESVSVRARWVSSVRLVAIEAKLSRWRDAIAQAEQYLGYADEAYVVIPSETGQSALASLQEFKHAGVGLMVFDGLDLRCHQEPTASTTHDWRREFVCSRFNKKC